MSLGSDLESGSSTAAPSSSWFGRGGSSKTTEETKEQKPVEKVKNPKSALLLAREQKENQGIQEEPISEDTIESLDLLSLDGATDVKKSGDDMGDYAPVAGGNNNNYKK